MEFSPILLKALVLAAGISQTALAEATEASRPTINLCLNRGYVPKTMTGFKPAIEEVVRQNPKAMAFLQDRRLSPRDIWQPLGQDLRNSMPDGHAQRSKNRKGPAMMPGNPETITIREVEMVKPEALKHFKLFRGPFINDVQRASDIYMDDDHRYIEAAMLDAAKHSGFLAIVGEVGSGKTIMRKRVVEVLRGEGDLHIVYPQILDKQRIGSASLCDAIIMSISTEAPKIKHEHKARQVRRLLMERNQQNGRCCLIIEEAHQLTVPAFKTLKQLHELEDATGYKKLLGIIVIGQTELGGLLDERYHPEMREVIRRCQIACIQGLTNVRAYLEKKVAAVGGKLDTIIEPDALTLLQERLTTKDERGKNISTAYPLTVNLYVTRAMNLAYDLGEGKITADVVQAL
jgi:type II secretory pathway predicted ATPase ExeA